MESVFYKKPELYERDMGFLDAYTKDIIYGLHKSSKQPLDVCINYVTKELRPGGRLDIKDPVIKLLVKDENEDRVYTETTFTRYVNAVLTNDLIFAPSMTLYTPKKVEVAFTTVYIDEGVANRSKNKKMAYAAIEAGDIDTYVFKWNQQSVDKVLNNGLSGAQCNEHTILYCPTIHSALTSTSRMAASSANSNNERILSGNRHYWSPDIVEANFLAIARLIDKPALEAVMTKHNLYYPTAEDIMEMVDRSSKFYYTDYRRTEDIYRLAASLDPIDRAGILYTSDLYHLAKHNDAFVRGLLDSMSTVVESVPPVDPSTSLAGLSSDQMVLVAYMCSSYIRGSKISSIDEFTVETQNIIRSTAENVKVVINEHVDFFRVIFCSAVMPHTVANVPTMLRRVTVLSDTDSAVYTVQYWIEWFHGQMSFDVKPTNVGHCVSYLTSTSIVHILASMCKNMGVAEEELFRYEMKAEKYYPIFGLTSRAKTYYAATRGQEGHIFKEDEPEIKGSVLKGSNAPKDVMDQSDAMMAMILSVAGSGNKISLYDEIARIAKLEHALIERVTKGDNEILPQVEIKEAQSYKLGPYQSNYFHYMLWEQVFAPKYGSYDVPPYRGIRLPLNTDSNARVKVWLSKMEDQELAQRLAAILVEGGKNQGLGSIVIPLSAVQSIGVPEEIVSAMNIRGVVASLMDTHYVLLESLGFYMMEGNHERLLSDSH